MGVNTFSLANIAYNTYLNVYANWEKWDKHTHTDCLAEENKYTFADDMVIYMGNPNELEKYIKRMLSRFCKGNKQAYFEMILSTMTMANLFYSWGAEEESEICTEYYSNLFFNEDIYTKYITEDELSDLWGLR